MGSSSPVGNPSNLQFDPTAEFGFSAVDFTAVLRGCQEGGDCGQSWPFEDPPIGNYGSPMPFRPGGWKGNGHGGRNQPIGPQPWRPVGSWLGGGDPSGLPAGWEPISLMDYQDPPSGCDPNGDDCGPTGDGHLSVQGDTVSDGQYTITASTADGGTITVTDNHNHKETFTVWGDPHIKTGAGGTANFQHTPVTFKLPDGTEITVTPTDNPGVNTIDHVTITSGDDAATITGFKSHLKLSSLPGDGRHLDATTPDGVLVYAKNGNINDLVVQNGGPEIHKKTAKPVDLDPYASLSVGGPNGDTIYDGRYTIVFSDADSGTITVTDNVTKETFTVWGDPHIKTSAGGIANFQHAPVTFKLPDGTEITVTPTDNPGVNTIARVTITKGNEAVTITGFKSGDPHAHLEPGEGYRLDAHTAHGTMLYAKHGNIDDLVVGNGKAQIYKTNIGNIDRYAGSCQPPCNNGQPPGCNGQPPIYYPLQAFNLTALDFVPLTPADNPPSLDPPMA